MNQAIEFHDSTLSSISEKRGTVVLHFDKAYIHQSKGKPGIDNGTGWLQAIDIELTGAEIDSMPHDFPVDLDDGVIVINDESSKNGLALPVEASGEVKLNLKTVTGEELKITARHISSIEKSELEYVEEFNV
jgi:hypothetical protein